MGANKEKKPKDRIPKDWNPEKVMMNSTQRECFQILYAIEQSLNHLEPHTSKLLKRVPGGWGFIRTASAMMEKVVNCLICTIPIKQLKTIEAQMAISDFRVQTRSVAKDPDLYWVLSRDQLAVLVGSACDSKCIMCDLTREEMQKCPLRDVIKDMPVEGMSTLTMPCFGGDFIG